MPRRPSGNPPLKALAVKLPAPVIEEIRRYSDLHGVTISDLIREGLDMRLHGPQQAAEYNGNTALPMATVTMLTRLATTLTAAAEQLRSVRNGAVVSRGEEPQSAAELQSYNSNTVASGEEYNGNTISKAPDSEACPPFDTARYVLGKLCPQKHEWGTTGQSLRRLPNRGCKTCENMAKKQARAAKRQATLG